MGAPAVSGVVGTLRIFARPISGVLTITSVGLLGARTCILSGPMPVAGNELTQSYHTEEGEI